MNSLRLLLALLTFSFFGHAAQAAAGQKEAVATARQTKVARHGAQVRWVLNTTSYMQDALRLSTAQYQTLNTKALAELRGLNRASSQQDVARVQRRHLLAMGRVLSPSQFLNYVALRNQLMEDAEFMTPLEIANR